MLPSEIMFLAADTVSALSLFTARRSNKLLHLYPPEQILLLCWLREKQVRVQINVPLFVLKFDLSVLCGKMHPESRQTGVPQPPSPGSKDAADDEREKTCKRQELFQRPGLVSKERRKHIFAKKNFRTRERHPTDLRNKTTIHPVNYRCVLNHVPRKIQLE